MSRKAQIIAVGSQKRVGKDTFCNILLDEIRAKNYSACKFSFADPLKNSCKSLIMNEFGIDVFTEDDREKDIIRPILIAVASAHRKQTRGAYYVNLLLKKALYNPAKHYDYVLISDLRFAEYPETDELFALKSLGAKVVTLNLQNPDGSILQSDITEELENYKTIAENSDFNITWSKEQSGDPERDREVYLANRRIVGRFSQEITGRII